MTREEALEIAKGEAMTRGGTEYDEARASIILGVYSKGVEEARIRACDEAAEMVTKAANAVNPAVLASRIRKIADNVR